MNVIKPEEIQKKVDDAIAQFGDNLTVIEKRLLSEIELLLKDLELDGTGRIKSNTANLKKITNIGKKLERIIISKKYIGDVTSFVRSFSELASMQSRMYEIRNERLSMIEKMSIDGVIEGLTESGVKANIVNPIRDMLVKNVISGGKYTDMMDSLRNQIQPAGKDGVVSRYLKTYTLDSINTFSANYNKIISDIGKYQWFQYTGSLIETSREFCEKMVEKKYFHVSEIPELLKGHINNHKCEISDKTGLPKGMKAETTKENFHQLRGGWNCGHQIIGLPEGAVPKALRDKIVYEQNQGIEDGKGFKDGSGELYFDPTGIKTFADLTSNMTQKVSAKIKKRGFENFLKHNEHKSFYYKKGNVYAIQGAKYNDAEFQTAVKLAKAGYHVVFPRQGDLGKGRINDVYVYDSKKYIQRKVELKALYGDTAERVKSQIISGSGQADVVAYDIQSGIKRNWLIKGLREGWNDNMKSVLINWRGQWYELSKKELFDDKIYKMLP
ncbi:hypothetical protein [Proteiniphilum sp. X52]|uniref:hypothetical protein n=1 Tax=Proteiniphilum sp. X52 TaxID=2382159 RepID=UPI000F09EDD7|nr:hypothetical protein [Proteiniphilum sp. X52]RNC66469.1 hypothetical protein D7D25_03035 [Proteiniphilum sp. X52]